MDKTFFPDYGESFRTRIVPLLCSIIFFSVLNGTMFNVAVPDIAAEFALSPTGVSWVVTGYIVVFALAAAVYGKLADLYPVRRLITIGLLLFNAGAILGFFAHQYPMLIVARLVQACGGGAIPAMGMLVATRYFPPELRGRVLGAIASTVAFAAGVGPVIGGGLAGLHWHFLFLPSIATLAAIPFFLRFLPREVPQAGRFDLSGALLLCATISLLLLFVAQGMMWALPGGGGLLAVLAIHLRRSPDPFMPPGLFRNHLYRSGLLTTFLGISSVFGMFFLVPLLLRQEHGLDSWSIGLVIFPGAMSAAVLGNIGGRMSDRVGSPAIVRTGLTLLIAGYLLLAGLSGSGQVTIALCLVVCYVGFAFIQASLAKTVSTTLSRRQTGIGMGVYNLVFFTAGAFGAALAGFLLEYLPRYFPSVSPLDGFRGVFLLGAAAAVAALLLFSAVFRPGREG